MIKRFSYGLFLLGVLAILAFDARNDDGRAGKTGSPGEQTCVNTCHDSFALNSGTGSISISSPDMTNWLYVPGMTYTINVEVEQNGIGLFGFGAEVLEDIGNTSAGQMLITQASETEIQQAIILGQFRDNVVHTLNGGQGSNSKTFSFDWTAPANPIDSLTIYAAGVAANGNGNNNGDRVYTTSQDIVLFNVGIEENETKGLSIFPNPTVDELYVQYERLSESGTITIHDNSGKLKHQRLLNAGSDIARIDISALIPGLYLVKLETSNAVVFSERFIVR